MSDESSQSLADQYAALWQSELAAPDVWAFLRGHPGATAAAVAEVLLADQWRRYEAWRPRPIEEYLAGTPALEADPQRKLDLVHGDYRAARRFGPPPDVEALAARFPDLAEALRQHVAVEELVAPTQEAEGSKSAIPTADLGPLTSDDWIPPAPPGYEFARELGRGGFGAVWLARHLALDKPVAVKHLRPGRVSDRAADQLVREARTMAALKVHPNRVTVFDLVRTDAGWFLVMDYVDGGLLSRLTGPGRPLEWERAARYVADVADGLVEVHARGVCHRDIKPDNVLLDPARDVAVLTDFGLASDAAAAAGCCGTPGYMAPELYEGMASAKTDVFALAATLFHLVTGRPPFDPHDVLTSLMQASAGPNEAALAGLPAGLAAVLRAGLEPSADRRPDLAAFAAQLRGCHTAGLADRLRALADPGPRGVKLDVTVSTASERELVFSTVFAGALPAAGAAAWPAVRCGEVVRIEASTDADGYLTVLNLGSAGEVSVLFPNPRVPDNRVRAGRPQRVTVKLTPPAGTDYAVLVWTPGPCPLSAREWREQLESGRLAIAPVSERGMEFVAADAPGPAGPDWVAAVVGIEHGG
jgi:hypothetical protein